MNFFRDITREVIDVARIPVDTLFNPDGDHERERIRRHRERVEAIRAGKDKPTRQEREDGDGRNRYGTG